MHSLDRKTIDMNKENENQAMVSKGLSEKSGIKEVETTTSALEKLNGRELKTGGERATALRQESSRALALNALTI